MNRWLIAAALVLWSTPVFSQVQQSGTVTPGHAARFVTNGVIGDAGTAASGNLTTLGVTASGSGICQNSAAITAVGYQQVCIGATTAGGGYLSVQNFGTAVAQGFSIVINGTAVVIPTGGSSLATVTTPLTSGGVMCASGTAGLLINCAVGTANFLTYWTNASTLAALATANNGVLITSAGGVPSISSTLPSATQLNITSVGTIATGVWNGTVITVPFGGTGATSLAAGAIVGNGTSALTSVATASVGLCLLSNGTGVAPSWGGCSSGAGSAAGSNTQVQFNNASALAGSANLTFVSPALTIGQNATTTGQLVLANGGALGVSVTVQNPSATSAYNFNVPISAGTSGQPLISGGGGSTAMTFGTLGISGGGTNCAAASGTCLDNIAGFSSTGFMNRTGAGTYAFTSQIGLANGGTAANLTASNGGIVYSTASELAILTATATAGQIIRSGASAAPTWSTATYPATTTANQLLYSSATNVIGGLTSANDGVLITSGAGVPSISTTIPLATQSNITRVGTITTGVWNGTDIPLDAGGTNATLTASNGGIVYSTASAMAILAGTATANLPLLSGSSTTPSWAAISYPTSATSGGIAYFSSTSAMASSGVLGTNNVVIGGGAGSAPLSTPIAALVTAGSGIAVTGSTVAVVSGSHVQNAQTGTTYTVLTGDNGKFVTFSNAASIAVTLPQAGGSFPSGWSVNFINIGVGTVTITPTTSTINGASSYVLATNQAVTLFSNGTNYFANGGATVGAGGGTVTSISCGGVVITAAGTCPPVESLANCSLAATVATNILTVALKDAAGNDATATSPCTIYFRNVTAATGSWSGVSVTAALSINTNATGATLGSANATAFRFWVVAFNNAGTVVLGLFNASTATTCNAIDEALTTSSTAISGSATSAGVFYTPNGTTISSKALRILGYVEYDSAGLTTAGTYASAPDFVQTFGAGINKPCSRVQHVTATAAIQESTTSATFVASANARVSIIPKSAANLIRVQMAGMSYGTPTLNITAFYQMSRGTTANTNMIGSFFRAFNSAGFVQGPVIAFAWDKPNTVSATTYTMQWKCDGTNAALLAAGSDTGLMEAEEIQG